MIRVKVLRGPFEGKIGSLIENGNQFPETFFISIGELFNFTTPVARQDVEIIEAAEV